MNNIETSYYKGFSVQALIYKHERAESYSNVRCYDVAVKIGREDDPTEQTTIFKLEAAEPFMDLGDARRAAEAYAHKLINSDQVEKAAKRAAKSIKKNTAVHAA